MKIVVEVQAPARDRLVSYLLTNGWNDVTAKSRSDGVRIFQTMGNDKELYAVWVMPEEPAREYNRVTSRLFSVLELVEGRSVLEIYADVVGLRLPAGLDAVIGV